MIGPVCIFSEGSILYLLEPEEELPEFMTHTYQRVAPVGILPEYGFLFVENRSALFTTYKPVDGLVLVGYAGPPVYTLGKTVNGKTIYLIEYKEPFFIPPNFKKYEAPLDHNFSSLLVDTFTSEGYPLEGYCFMELV